MVFATGLDGAIVSSHYYLFEVDTEKLHPPYLEVVSQAEILQQQIVAKGSTNYASVRPSDVLRWHIPLPDLEIQKQIARNFQAVQKKLVIGKEEISHQQSLVAKLKQAILQDAVQGKLTADWRAANPETEPASKLLHRIETEKVRIIDIKKIRPQKHVPKIIPSEIPFDIPEGWVWCRTADIGLVLGGLTKNAAKRGDHKRTLPYLRVANVYANRLDLTELQEIGVSDSEVDKLLLEKDDLLVVEGNGSQDQIGRIARWDGSVDPCVHQNHVIKIRLGEPKTALWTLYWFLSPNGRALIEEQARTSTGLYNLSTGKVASLPVPLPPLAEQMAIVEKIASLMGTCRDLETEIEHSCTHVTNLLQTILKEAFVPA